MKTKQGKHEKSFLLQSSDSEIAFNMLSNKVKAGSRVLCITRSNSKTISSKYSFEQETIWIGGNEEANQIYKTENILERVKEFVQQSKNSTVLLDRMDYLIKMHGFDSALKFIYNLNDIFSNSNSTLIVRVNPLVIEPAHLKLIKEEITELPSERKDSLDISEDLKEILRYIIEKGDLGKKVYFKNITYEFHITKTTTRKRIKALEELSFVKILKDGRNKIVSLNEDALELFQHNLW